MAKWTLEQLRDNNNLDHYKLLISEDESLSFGAGLLEHIDILQQLSHAEQVRVANYLVFICTNRPELMDKLDQFVTNNVTQEHINSPGSSDFFTTFFRAHQIAKELLTLVDKTNNNVHEFFRGLPTLSATVKGSHNCYQINDDFREMFKRYTPFEQLAFNFFDLETHQEAISINLARHTPEKYRQEIMLQCSRGFSRDFYHWVQNAFRVDVQLNIFTGDEPHIALINREVPRLDYFSGEYEELFVSDLYCRYRLFVHERLVGKEKEIAQKLEFHMTPELFGFLRDLEKDSRDIHKKTDCYSAPAVIVQRLEEVSSFSSHRERFGIFRAVTLSICPQVEQDSCTIS